MSTHDICSLQILNRLLTDLSALASDNVYIAYSYQFHVPGNNKRNKWQVTRRDYWHFI